MEKDCRKYVESSARIKREKKASRSAKLRRYGNAYKSYLTKMTKSQRMEARRQMEK